MRARFSCGDNFRNFFTAVLASCVGRSSSSSSSSSPCSSRTYDFTASSLQPLFFSSSCAHTPRPPLNVRQVIYTRGFTARKILRKAVTRDRNATSLFFLSSKKSFFTRSRACILLLGNFSGGEKSWGEVLSKKYASRGVDGTDG